jgi:5,5'-dehydrodivanillate O-demethylase oxygenase subunit
MLTPEENALFTQVDPGTPGGEMLRRYWWPIEYGGNIGKKPCKVRFLAENFVLFRDARGVLGMLDLQCAHRRASLEYGRVEDDGLRCAYHGWMFDVAGRCIDQPQEPAGSTFKDKVCQRAYPVREAGGMVYAYIGPHPVPEFPRLDILEPRPGKRYVRGNRKYANWFQFAENLMDAPHIPVLHASGYPDIAMKRAEMEYEPTRHGVRTTMRFTGIERSFIQCYFFPASIWVTTARVSDAIGPSHNLFYHTPMDNENTHTFNMRFVPENAGEETIVTDGLSDFGPGVYQSVDDGWWGIESFSEDRIIQESQGIVFDRTRENLGASDRGILILRGLMRDAIKAVREGRDPINVLREPNMAPIRVDASMPQLGALV